jgi:hypothetical protein
MDFPSPIPDSKQQPPSSMSVPHSRLINHHVTGPELSCAPEPVLRPALQPKPARCLTMSQAGIVQESSNYTP